MTNDKKRKLQLEYPCPWVYKIIGDDENEMRRAVAEIICDRAYKITHSRDSTTDKYHCLNIELSVESESHRTTIYEAMKVHRAVKIVL
jgi:uncharacterized protein